MMNLYPILIASLWPALVLSIYPYRLNDNIPSVSYLNTPQGKGDERAIDKRAWCMWREFYISSTCFPALS